MSTTSEVERAAPRRRGIIDRGRRRHPGARRLLRDLAATLPRTSRVALSAHDPELAYAAVENPTVCVSAVGGGDRVLAAGVVRQVPSRDGSGDHRRPDGAYPSPQANGASTIRTRAASTPAPRHQASTSITQATSPGIVSATTSWTTRSGVGSGRASHASRRAPRFSSVTQDHGGRAIPARSQEKKRQR